MSFYVNLPKQRKVSSVCWHLQRKFVWALKSVDRETDKCVLWQQDDNYTEETCLVAKLRRCDCPNKGLECNNHLLQGADNDFSFYINSARTAMIEVHFQVTVSQLLHSSRLEYACLLCRASVTTINHSPPLPTKSPPILHLPLFISVHSEHSGQLFVCHHLLLH